MECSKKNKNAETINIHLKTSLKIQKGNRVWLRLMTEKNLYTKTSVIFQIKNFIKRCSRSTSRRAVFAKRNKRIIRRLPEQLFSEKGTGNCIDKTFSIRRQINDNKHSSSKLAPIEASLRKWGFCYAKFTRQKEENNNKILSWVIYSEGQKGKCVC